jgi:glyoxylase-like metal-dependent hydrolase (beta-lactamase superfamily II)
VVDTGTTGDAQKILAAVREWERTLLTSAHPGHSPPSTTPGLGGLKRLTGAAAYMHPLSAAVVRGREIGRALRPTPGLLNGILWRVFMSRPHWNIPPALVEHEILDGDIIPVAGGIRAIHVPGHCAGQLAFHIMRGGGVLLAADTAAHMARLGLMPGYEDLETGLRSLAKLARFRFEVAGLGMERRSSVAQRIGSGEMGPPPIDVWGARYSPRITNTADASRSSHNTSLLGFRLPAISTTLPAVHGHRPGLRCRIPR